ncbi:hypothetical protein NC652_015709 [Populus alba x Populus x berolinensis]|nr:hypothetical protein NC652_015709 [Populus alba x Populus x berolinensis]
MFNKMKMAGCCPDVVTYTMMLHAYNAAEHWKKACALLQEMEEYNIQPDTIACSALMRAFNKGGDPSKVLILAEFMREREIPLSDAIFFEMVSACSLLRDWRTTIELIKLMEPSFSVVSIGLLNQLLHLLGKSGKIESMMKFFYKIIGSGAEINCNTYSILLKNLLAVGNWRKYIEVLEWMEEARVQPSNGMYFDILSFAQKSGATYSSIIQERVESLRRKSGNEVSTSKEMYNKKLVTAVDAPDESSLSWVMLEHFLSMSIDARSFDSRPLLSKCRIRMQVMSVIKDDARVSYAIVAGDGNGLM